MPIVLDTIDATFGSISSAAQADKWINVIPVPIVAAAAKNWRREQSDLILMSFNKLSVAVWWSRQIVASATLTEH
jgi:hypothetical protein